jgi:hypothetical protein
MKSSRSFINRDYYLSDGVFLSSLEIPPNLLGTLRIPRFEINILPSGDRCIISISGNDDTIFYAPQIGIKQPPSHSIPNNPIKTLIVSKERLVVRKSYSSHTSR